MLTPERYEFGGFALDVFERRLTHGSRAVALAPKAFDVLVGLVRHGGRLITKRELLDQVWPESCVEEGILSVHISALRKALGHECIETVAKSGYRFHGLTDKPAIPLRAHTEVYELFGRGRAHLLSASLGEIPQALEAFRAAIELDPLYAEAHAGLALAHCAQAELRLTPHADAYRDARASALRSLALDPASADAQAALGKVLFLSEWNWAAAERSFDRALALNSQHTEAHLLSGQLLEALGRLDEGLERKRQALQRDPFSASVYLQISLSYWNQRRYDDSIEWANKALELNPRHLLAREHLSGAYWKQGDFDRHMAENIKHAETYGVPSSALEPLRQAYTEGGRPGVVKLMLERMTAQPNAPDFQLAILFAEAGDLDTAFRHLDRAIEGHDPALVHLAVAPQWDSLRGDTRFDSCLARMGLPGTVRC
jgi:DNA-binding winged helix-turn-helix (wHTH) protein